MEKGEGKREDSPLGTGAAEEKRQVEGGRHRDRETGREREKRERGRGREEGRKEVGKTHLLNIMNMCRRCS